MVLKIYGMTVSTCTRRVATVCKALDIPYELIGVNFAVAEHKSPAYLEKQPFGQVPYIDDDGFILFESRAICRYLALKYGKGKLIPSDLPALAKFEQAASIETSNFDAFASVIAAEKVFKPMQGLTTNDALVTQLAATLETKLNGYEAILSKQKYLAGDELTLADLFHLPYGSMLEPCGFKFLSDTAKHPNVARWWSEISSHPAWLAVKDGA
ncbi:glutathione S-transferase [Punctularia strigosozonata HHB-11173 SS5]|uniref:glutathione transferase n=1 Tax=Punctularia strigosozonata (strain HHB-11173) TaxID=741275 RepID=R7RZY1_PUNST|nr:glutathione S-transferase [Punctularia strigosozonata HHB-11173 SS5]EIN03543.1 glutathione S-transferase [Punctularia strigosozonata HHB-11173 SS5]